MSAFEYTNKCDTRYFQFFRQNENTKNEHAGIKRKKNVRKSKRRSVIISYITKLYLYFCSN